MLSFWASVGFIIIMAYVMHILLEAPFGVLEGMLTPKPKPKRDIERMETKESPNQQTAKVDNATLQQTPSPSAPDS